MKTPNAISVLLASIILIIFHISPVRLAEPSPQSKAEQTDDDYPPQEFCKNREAIRRSNKFLVNPVIIWSITKITKMPEPYPEDLPKDKNVCSAFTFIAGCGMIRYTLTGWTPSYQDIQTIAYRHIGEHNENVMVLDRRMTFKDKHYEVLYSEAKKMVYVNSKGETTVENEIPKPMTEINGEPILYAMVGKGPNDEWRIFQMCDRDVTWVAVPTEKAKPDLKKYLETYEHDIKKRLNELKVDTSPTRMVDIEKIEFPFEPKDLLPPYKFS